MKFRDIIHILENEGFRQTRQEGSHRRFEGMVGGVRQHVTVAGNPGDDVLKATLA